jgi:DNA-binding PadR family transcriptional regulator
VRKKSLDPIALSVLALLSEGPQHPYELQRTLHQRRKDFADGKLRALYHAVDRLAHARLIEPVETSRDGRRPERTVYRITPEGRDEMAVRLTDLLETPPAEAAPFGIALSFLAYVSPRAAVEALQQRALLLEGQIAALDAGLQTLAGQFRMPRLALVEEEWNRAQRQAERDFTLHLVDAIRDDTVTWDINWDALNPFDPPLPPATGDAEQP